MKSGARLVTGYSLPVRNIRGIMAEVFQDNHKYRVTEVNTAKL